MKKFFALTLGILLFSYGVHAACPAAPVGSNQDRVIQMVAGADGLTKMAKEEVTDATEEGAVVYDATNNTLAVCDGTNWVTLGLRTDCGVGSRLEWDGAAWQCTVAADACSGSPSPGTTCADGSVYAGLSPDGNVPMFTTPADAPGLMSWNNGTANWFDTPMVNCTGITPGPQASCRTGEENTTLLVGLSGSHAPYNAAVYCDGLTAHGHSDWYLPAQDEMNVLYYNQEAIGGFNTNALEMAGLYWSSTELSNRYARRQIFDGINGGYPQWFFFKNQGLAVRCVRR